VISAGESNTAPGVTEVKRSALRGGHALGEQKLVIKRNINAMASSKQGQSSNGRRMLVDKQTSVTTKRAGKGCKQC